MTRNQQIITAYQSGAGVTELAKEHGVSRQRINQLVRGAGCPLRNPNKSRLTNSSPSRT